MRFLLKKCDNPLMLIEVYHIPNSETGIKWRVADLKRFGTMELKSDLIV